MKTILIVDDASIMRMMLKDILSKAGYKICGEAKNGNEAVELYKKLKPDLVTLDISMPECDGITALREIIKINPEAKVVMISALGQKVQVLDSIRAGALDFIIKPFEDINVINTINNILNS